MPVIELVCGSDIRLRINLDQAGIKGKGPTWGISIPGKYVGAPPSIDSTLIRVIPGTERNINHARHYPLRNPGRDNHRSPFVENPNHVSVGNTSGLSIGRVDQNRLRLKLPEPGNVVKLSVRSPLEMGVNQL